MIRKLYRLRWGIEVAFRGLKQTFGRRKLRSRRADRVAVELEWSLLGLGVLQLLALEQQPAEVTPLRISTAQTLEAVRDCLEQLHERPAQQESLPARLANATIDSYQRTSSKAARYQAKCYEKPVAGKPKIKNALAKHKQQIKQLLAA